jgi:transcriptional repressor NrdR
VDQLVSIKEELSVQMKVTKRDGSSEVFMPEKVVVSAVKAGAPYETARDIASSLSKRKESTMKSSEIRKHVLSELRTRKAASAADSWEAYDKMHKKM